MDFTIHQYLLNAEEPVLIPTGMIQQAEEILPEITAILNGRPLRYILVSHRESDECRGLDVFREAYPEATVVCSALTTREHPGLGSKDPFLHKTAVMCCRAQDFVGGRSHTRPKYICKMVSSFMKRHGKFSLAVI